MKNANKSPKIPYSTVAQWGGKEKSDPESVSRTGAPPKVN